MSQVDAVHGGAYVRNTYNMTRYELNVPKVLNNGKASNYPDAVRAALEAAGITGWTETEYVGVWFGTREPGVMFIIYSTTDIMALLSRIGRECMPDQEAVQVVHAGSAILAEA